MYICVSTLSIKWAHINGWIGRILTRDVQDVLDVGYIYLYEFSEFKVGGWAHINGW